MNPTNMTYTGAKLAQSTYLNNPTLKGQAEGQRGQPPVHR